MTKARDELNVQVAYVEALEALAKAKAAHADHPTPASRAKLQAAKEAVFELRGKWRTVREAFAPDAVVPTVAVKASTKGA